MDLDDEITDAQFVSATAYQVIGALASAAGLVSHPEVIRALDWFSEYECGQHKDLLPWGRGLQDIEPTGGRE